jgi:citrate lyase subunit beta / citryl-CoA lyase
MSLLRSYLFAPGNREDLLRKVLVSGADAAVLDLEDAVPADQKSQARALVAEALAAPGVAPRPRVFVRINGVATAEWEADLKAVVRPGLAGIRMPKVESASEVHRVDTVLGRLEAERGLGVSTVQLTLAIESAQGVEAAVELARASARVRNLCFGAADFAADVGADPSEDERETLFARSRLVLASRVARLDPPIAPVHTRIDDDEGLRASCEAARRLGFFGRSCVHPRQVPLVNAAFQPDDAAVARARSIVNAFERASRAGSGATTLRGEFVDQAVLRRARGVLAIAEGFGEGDPA